MQWSTTVEDYYPVNPRPRWGYEGSAHLGVRRALERHRITYEAVIAELGRHRAALYAIPLDADPAARQPGWNNVWFSCLDAAALVGILLARRPKRYIEIGSGHSTLFARHGVRWGEMQTTITSIDPHPRVGIDSIANEVIRAPLEDCGLELFDRLDAGDILFFDGSHRVFANSDVTTLMFDVLPRLKPGVLVHLHDIFWPHDYPAAWNKRLYSEQYLVGSMLMCGAPPFRVIFPCHFVSIDPALSVEVQRIFDARPEAPIPFRYANGPRIPGVSFWLETRALPDAGDFGFP